MRMKVVSKVKEYSATELCQFLYCYKYNRKLEMK